MNVKKLIKIIFITSLVLSLILSIYSGGNKFYLSMFYYLVIIYWSVCIVNPTYARSLMPKNKTDTLSKYQIVMNRVLGVIWIIISIHWLRLINKKIY